MSRNYAAHTLQRLKSVCLKPVRNNEKPPHHSEEQPPLQAGKAHAQQPRPSTTESKIQKKRLWLKICPKPEVERSGIIKIYNLLEALRGKKEGNTSQWIEEIF